MARWLHLEELGGSPVTRGRRAMKSLVTDELWEHFRPLLPTPPRRRFRFPGRKPLDYRKILTCILFVLKTGIACSAPSPAKASAACGTTERCAGASTRSRNSRRTSGSGRRSCPASTATWSARTWGRCGPGCRREHCTTTSTLTSRPARHGPTGAAGKEQLASQIPRA
jgi:hypothetical protein